jgi:hypothetical protein
MIFPSKKNLVINMINFLKNPENLEMGSFEAILGLLILIVLALIVAP